MKYTQNEKIMQITENTLIIGVDIASDVHYARAFDYRGIELDKVIKFNNDIQGFKVFSDWITKIATNNHKQHVMVGMEPTGHYWFTFAQYLEENNIKIVLVNPYHVKTTKELDDNSPTKNDRKDPKTIAMLMKDGRYMEPYIPKGIYSELRNATNTRWQLVKKLNSIRNQVKRWIKIYFPEFNNVFADWEGKAALIILKHFPTPEKITKLDAPEIIATWRKEISRAVGIKRATKLIKAAKASVGIKEGLIAAENELHILLEEYELLMKQHQNTMSLIEKLTMQIPGVKEILKIKGVGLKTLSGFIAEVGDIERFDHPKKVQKLAGLNLKENSSGKHKGQTTITKRGRKRLRSILFSTIMPIVAKNKEFQQLHKYYTTRKENPLKKKQSLIVLCCKLIRVFFVILKTGVKYDPVKMMNDIKRPTLQEVA